MKTKSLHLFAFIFTAMFLFTSCAKDSLVSQEEITVTTKSSKSSALQNTNRSSKQAGSICGLLSPAPIKSSIVAYTEEYSSEEVIAADDGTFIINDLAPGIYSLKIDYVSTGVDEYNTIIIGKITVDSGVVTDIGTINLQ